MDWQYFRRLTTPERYYRVKQMTKLDLIEHERLIDNIVYARYEGEFIRAKRTLKQFERNYKGKKK